MFYHVIHVAHLHEMTTLMEISAVIETIVIIGTDAIVIHHHQRNNAVLAE